MKEIINYKLTLKKEANILATILLFIWLVFALLILGIISYGITTTLNRIFDWLPVLLITGLVILIVLDNFLWQINGKEVLIIYDKTIKIQRTGKIFKRTSVIYLSTLKDVSLNEDDDIGLAYRFYGLKGGKIIILTDNDNISFGQNISSKSARKYVNEINVKIKELQKDKTKI